ncbi:PadR family transcriptional regulator [Kutzneria kofuensis]|uniref:DNA-binding PadR family transcriptional regulator n=1 Tax=Kutzneria kofuensis TaxID=103725 RepID=A0A7W9NMW8_9PSEU|nr:PadR family transcriptional regulator [Kutzneria kofuensis]MBB5897803.1 DNA-binding PadR family transcriptional regulator [Kutzneria kofuensis]
MNSTRLFALSALARRGPLHGYAIRQAAQLDRTELWTDVKPGSLYNALKRMTEEGLVRVARTERDGNPPERTVFEITAAGRAELVAQRDAALADVRLLPDPVDLALQFTPDLSPDELTTAFTARRRTVADRLAQFERERETAAPDLVGLEPLIFEHCVARLRAELAWHDDVLDRLKETT